MCAASDRIFSKQHATSLNSLHQYFFVLLEFKWCHHRLVQTLLLFRRIHILIERWGFNLFDKLAKVVHTLFMWTLLSLSEGEITMTSPQTISFQVQNGNSSFQNGNSSVQNGKIIISINIKKLQRDNMGVQLWWLLAMPHVTQILKKFLVKKNF